MCSNAIEFLKEDNTGRYAYPIDKGIFDLNGY